MPDKSPQPTEKQTRPGEKARSSENARNEQRSLPPRDSNSAAGDTEQQALADAVDDLDGRD